MSPSNDWSGEQLTVSIPADIDRLDKILAGLTARQVAIAATAAVIVWAGWVAARHVLPLPAFAVLATPVALTATALVTGERAAGSCLFSLCQQSRVGCGAERGLRGGPKRRLVARWARGWPDLLGWAWNSEGTFVLAV